jgi:hypothetical protein
VVKTPKEIKDNLYTMSFNHILKSIEKPKNNSIPIINLAKKGAHRKLEIPKSTKIISNGSIG